MLAAAAAASPVATGSNNNSTQRSPSTPAAASTAAVATQSVSTAAAAAATTTVNTRCAICLSLAEEPFSTPCAHTFCYVCLNEHLSRYQTCPRCRALVPPGSTKPACTTSVASTALNTPPTQQQQQQQQQHQVVTAAATPATPDISAATSTTLRAPPPLHRRSNHASLSSSAAAARRARAEAVAERVFAEVTLSDREYEPQQQQQQQQQQQSQAKATLHAHAHPLAHVPVTGDVLQASEHMSREELAEVIAKLNKKLQQKDSSSKRVENALILGFLNRACAEKQAEIARLRAEVDVLRTDIENSERERPKDSCLLAPETSDVTAGVPSSANYGLGTSGKTQHQGALVRDTLQEGHTDGYVPRADTRKNNTREDYVPGLAAKRRRVDNNFQALQSHYFSTVGNLQGEMRKRSLKRFTEDVVKLTQYGRFRCRASLLHMARLADAPGTDVFRASNIVSSIEFDRESELLATAGVTKRIKIFEFSNIMQNISEVHYPVQEIVAPSKLSWVCWNPYIRHQLVSSDYEGIVTLWDTNRAVALNEYEEHEKRAWSVDFCTADPRFFASASDDGCVKLWTSVEHSSVLTIENSRANICSVKFEPGSTWRLAFGSADHNVHYYDIRHIRQPVQVFSSHSRTVSYVKFMSPTELVSACVDSTIKLWDLNEMKLERTFTGHVNDKNFVGLTVTPDYIACGSEKNALFAYYKALPHPFTHYRFPNSDHLTGEEAEDDDESFVSSVCWCPKRPTMLVGANSLGVIKVLDLAGSDDASESSEETSSLNRT